MTDQTTPAAAHSAHVVQTTEHIENYTLLRFFAYIVDAIIVGIAAAVLRQFIPVWSLIVNLAVFVAYDTLLTSQKGATLGKSLLGLKVVQTGSAKNPSQESALARSIIKAIPFVGIILFIQMLMGKLPLHDEIAKTRVLKV